MFKKLNAAIALALILALTLAPAIVEAQQSSPGAPVTQTGSTGLAATTCVSNVGTSSVAITLTIPAPGGANSVYIDFLVLNTETTGAAGTPGSTIINWTTTNIAGTPSFPVNRVSAAAASSQVAAVGASGSLAIPIKGQVGLGPTFISPTAQTNEFSTGTVCFHVAP